ncbi:MAG: TrkA family potassium uptake protein [Chloroflexi bacterium]|uniref:Trk system potassium uptake protein TrkA n=1 Tax=Candidatus Chlorohelix allophototropha TaxID=3003348 RepID=A0A8T7M5R5_9CHLR|nr:TrkA family potassium uptake protein [Chloroflexota bacterium]WJW69353.1 TrkA family potassium uptake protein [Chloroflexota bacterium L227-S17]
MYIIIAGGGKVGRYLTEALVNDGYEVLLIEKIKAKVDMYTEQLGGVVVQGDACEAQVLMDAGSARADVIIAVTGDDEDNLVICQMAKRKFGVKRAIARVNNPKNEKIFHKLGIDATVSHTDAILNLIERQIPLHSICSMMNLHDSNLELVDVVIEDDSPAINRAISTLSMPAETSILIIVRNGKVIVPRGELVLNRHDEVLVIGPKQTEKQVRLRLLGDEQN